MKMVSAAKLRRAQEAIENARPYAERMRSTLQEVAGGMGTVEHALFEAREEVKTLELIVVTSDRGLAGAFNNAVIKFAEGIVTAREASVANFKFTLLGKKVGDYYKRRREGDILGASAVGNAITYAQAAEVVLLALENLLRCRWRSPRCALGAGAARAEGGGRQPYLFF